MFRNKYFTSGVFALGAYVLISACQGGAEDRPPVQLETAASIPVAEAKRLVGNYGPKAGYVIHDSDTLPDTRTIWFSKEQLGTLLAQINQEGGDGIRFYLAAYDNDQGEYGGYNTLLMVSTRDSLAGGERFHRDYFSESSTGAGGFVVAAAIENHGSLCPPWPPDKEDCEDVGALLLDE